MTNTEKLNLLEELLDIEKDSLSEDIELESLGEWDSIAVIATMAMFDSNFGKVLTPQEAKKFITVKDIMDKMD